ncbi:hypothetical protein OAQ99_04565 [Candidatus Kapabacteria bacterium]|nr:hypothetical protein [Candidatus Kapabacteria bacterium]
MKDKQELKRIYKIGGVLINNSSDIEKCLNFIFKESGNPFIIFSAIGKTTSELSSLINLAEQNIDFNIPVNKIIASHLKLVDNQSSISKILDVKSKIENYLDAIRTMGECTSIAKDKVLTFGEKLAEIIYYEKISSYSQNVLALDAEKYIKTDSEYNNAKLNINNTIIKLEKYSNFLQPILMAGFIGSDKMGNSTTMGFESSNLTSVVVALALNIKSVTWLTNVEGVYRCNPNLFEKTKKAKEINYTQALELSKYGLKLIPKSVIEIAQNNSIDIFIGRPDDSDFSIIKKTDENNYFLMQNGNDVIIIGNPKLILNEILEIINYEELIISKNSIILKSDDKSTLLKVFNLINI